MAGTMAVSITACSGNANSDATTTPTTTEAVTTQAVTTQGESQETTTQTPQSRNQRQVLISRMVRWDSCRHTMHLPMPLM